MNADHIVELNMIMSFFGVQRNSPWDGQMLGIPNNVWAFCWDFLRSMGQRSVGGAQVRSCFTVLYCILTPMFHNSMRVPVGLTANVWAILVCGLYQIRPICWWRREHVRH